MRGVVARIRSVVGQARVLSSPLDMYQYVRLRMLYNAGRPGQARAIRVRSLHGAPVLCRPSRDVWTFRSTFVDQYHTPPIALPEHATIVDLGSNVGYTVAHLAELYPSARIVGVEMDERNFLLAARNTARYGSRVRLVHAAAWIADDVVTYYGDHDDGFRVATSSGSGGTRSAPAMRVQTILDACGIEKVDYLKMDIEGAEAALLTTGTDWCDHVRSMKVEVHPPATVQSCGAVLEALGFRCWRDEHHPDCVCAVKEPLGAGVSL